jgi:hypothetical protein
MVLIPSVDDAWLFFKSAFLTILNKHPHSKNVCNFSRKLETNIHRQLGKLRLAF